MTKQLWLSVLLKDTIAATGQAGIRTHILTTPELESNALDRSATTLRRLMKLWSEWACFVVLSFCEGYNHRSLLLLLFSWYRRRASHKNKTTTLGTKKSFDAFLVSGSRCNTSRPSTNYLAGASTVHTNCSHHFSEEKGCVIFRNVLLWKFLTDRLQRLMIDHARLPGHHQCNECRARHTRGPVVDASAK